MSVNIGRLNMLAEVYSSQNVRKAAEQRQKPGNVRGDEVLISAEGKAFEQAKKLAAQLPDIREDRVAAVSSALESGALNIPASVLADKMLGSV